MYLKRKADNFLNEWKSDSNRMPLIVKGARQIGKTETILNFARREYKNVVYINFALQKKYNAIAEDGYEVSDIIKNITMIDPEKKFTADDTIIIFDEVQEYPDIATTLKSFKLDGRFDVILSGSMLGINYKKIHSNSVGYKTDYQMQSMDFEEFLWAKGYSDEHISDILTHMKELKPFNTTELSALKKLFLEYCVLGGMPNVVRTYIESDSFSGTLEIQNQIKLDYEEDVRKYSEGLDQTKIISVYRSIPVQLARENKKFQYSLISKNARSREYTGCIEWLADSGIVNECFCLNKPELPLKGNYDISKFKLYFADTGLLIASLDDEAQLDLRKNKNLGIYKGALYENFIAEALIKQGYGLYYYKKENSTVEQDFFIRTADELIPIEVKSNNNSAKSLKTMIKSKSYPDVKYGIKLADSNIGYADGIYTFPYFCAFLMKRYLMI